MPLRAGDATVVFENVRVVDRRPVEKREKSVICRLDDGREKFVPRSQCPADQYFPDDDDQELFDLEVSQWMVDQWEMEGEKPEEVVKLADVVCLRDTAKALQVRLADGESSWLPLKGVSEDSPVRRDGDRGELWLLPWCAKMKGWSEEAKHGSPDGMDEPDQQRAAEQANVGDDARGGFVDDGDVIPF